MSYPTQPYREQASPEQAQQPYPPSLPYATPPIYGMQGPGAAASRPVWAWVVLAAGLAAIIGSFLPWLTLTAPILGTITMSGTEGDGWLSVVLGAIVTSYAGLRLSGRNLPGIVAVVAGISALGVFAVGVWKIVDLNSLTSEMGSAVAAEDDPFGIGAALASSIDVSVGAGLWLITAAGLVGLIAVIAGRVLGDRGR